MGLVDVARNPWSYFIPLAMVGFLGNPPWNYSVVPVNEISFSLRSAFESVKSYSNFCPVLPFEHQIVPVNETVPDESELASFAAEQKIHLGGSWTPPHCRSHFLTTIVVPFRRRPEQMNIFVRHLHQFLMRQGIDYQVIVVNQVDDGLFNRGALLNIGFLESEAELGASGQNPARCYILHDVDLLPENLANVYACLKQPRHMSTASDSLRYTLPYPELVGGALAISADQFRTVNGFPTSYGGWGGEDDDLSRRLRAAGFVVQRFEPEVARYRMLRHKKATPAEERYKIASPREGLTSLRYSVKSVERKHLYTMINAAIIKY